MKLNFRKIASVLSSAVMVSSTVALAAAASYPAPFVNSGTADVAVVYGSAGSLDLAAVNNLVTSLNSKVTPGTTTTTTTTGESFTLQKTRDKFNLGDNLNEATIYSSLDVDELPTLLADGNYDGEDESDYTQELLLGAEALTFFQDDDFNDEKPIEGFVFTDGDLILNYTLDFDSPVAISQDNDITILGKKYYIADNSSADNSITLLDASASQRINEGDTVTVEASNGKTYTVKLDYVEEESSDTDEADANFIVNDEAIDAMEPGDTEEIEEGVYIVVDKVDYIDSDRRTSYAQFSLGTGKLVLTNGEEVELNDDPISTIDDMTSTLYANLTLSGGKLSALRLDWEASDDVWLAPGSDLVLPGFGGVKLTMSGLQSGEYEETSLEGSGDAYYLKTSIKDGEVSIPLMYHVDGNATAGGLGKDSDEILVTANPTTNGGDSTYLSLDQDTKPTFVATWWTTDEAESHALKLKKVINNSDDELEVTFDDLSSADDVVITGIGETVDLGEITLKLQGGVEADKTALINITPSSGSVYADRVVTANGLVVKLPVIGSNVAPFINYSNPTSVSGWVTIFNEEDDEDTLAAGGTFNVTYAVSSSDGFEPSNVVGVTTYETEEDSDQYIGYKTSELGTKIEMDKPSTGVNSITISYPDSQTYAEVMVAESGATISGGATGNIVPIFDTDTIPTDKNLIVVGGSCVNTLAAQLLGLPANSCGNAWQAKTNVGADQFLIQTFARDGGKVATLVAGYNMADTANAVNALKTNTEIDISAGKKYIGSATSVQAVTVA